jgi:hypothetical protein
MGVQMSNIEIGSLQDNYFHIGSTRKIEPTDTYFFSLPTMGSTRISAEGFSGDINMELRDNEGRLIKSISTSGKNTGILSIDNLAVADYILNVSPVSGNTNYQVCLTPDGKVDPLTGMGVEAGFFTTDQKGEVGCDLLHDGGRYKGEVAIFSLDGMEEFTSDSKEFITDNNSEPSLSSSASFIATLLPTQVNSGNSINFYFPVNLTGMVKDVQPNFRFSQTLPHNLPQPEELQVFLLSSDTRAFTLFFLQGRTASCGVRVCWRGK